MKQTVYCLLTLPVRQKEYALAWKNVCRASVMICDIKERSSILRVKFLRIKKSMAGESQVNDMTTRFGESFPMDLIAWNSFGW